jgi:hypothetical protein
LSLLADAGWHPGRSIDIAPYTSTLRRRGYPVFGVVRQFLSSFGGLSIRRPTPISEDVLEFDPSHQVVHIFKARVTSYERIIGPQLCIVGSYLGGAFTVLMDEEGKVYSGADDTLRYVAESGVLAIEVLLSCQGKSQLLQGE